jgi:uncharacterized small protein (DUF1192 family)
MKKQKKDGREFITVTRQIQEEVFVDEINEKIAGLEAMIVATQATLDDYKAKKKALEDSVK